LLNEMLAFDFVKNIECRFGINTVDN
jgi:hypothetical protein